MGLSSVEAARRLALHGANEPAPERSRAAWVELLAELGNPLVAVLLLAGAVSAFVGDLTDAAIIVTIVSLSVALSFTQTYRSRRAADRLGATVAPTATVLRDGVPREIPRAEVVPGDVIHLAAGDLVPADARLLDARDLHLQQAALTGESLPTEKVLVPGDESEESMVRLGTSVVSGTAVAVVVATGVRTMLGDIAAKLRAKPPDTEFDRGMRRFGALIMKAVFGLVMFILVVRLGTHRSAFESLLFAVALAVGLTPEFLPMITTVTLSRGAVVMAKHHVIVKHLTSIQNLGGIDVLCSDKTGTLTQARMRLEGSCDPLGHPSRAPLAQATLNSRFETGIRSPLDAAILEGAPERGDEDAAKVDEIPFDFERRRLSIVVFAGGERTLISKGAPEALFACCATYAEEGAQPAPLTEEARARCRAVFESMSARGHRVLAVATRRVEARAAYSAADERELTLLGFLTFTDPPREGAKEALAALKRDGVHVKILTGDNELVTQNLCGALGLDGARPVLGKEVEGMTDAALAHVAERTTVFARLSPAQKNRIILALKQRGHVVGYMGDGINDAPSLHAADVGISFASAVDVARDAADIILLEEGLDVLHRGIVEGRRAFANVTKYLLMGTSSNFGNMFSMAGASALLPFLPMLPTQVLLNNFLYDVAQLTIPTDHVDPEVLRRPQRWDVRTIRSFMLIMGPVSSLYDFLTFYVLLRVFHAGEGLFHTGWFVESLATQTLVLLLIRTPRSPLRSRPSAPLALTTLAVVAVGVALPFTPLARPLGFEPLPAGFFLFLVVAAGTYLALVEVLKRFLLGGRRRYRHRVPIAPGGKPRAA